MLHQLSLAIARVKELLEKNSTELLEKMFAAIRAARGERGVRETLTKLREEGDANVLETLTSTQKSQYDEMKGEKFEMPVIARFGGFGVWVADARFPSNQRMLKA